MLDVAPPGTSIASPDQTAAVSCTLPSRRNVLHVGAIAGLSLPALLQSQSRTAAAAHAHRKHARSVILVFLGGGLSHLDSFDPKPDAPSEIRGWHGSIATVVPGIRLCEKLPLLAKVMHRVALVRSASHTCSHHETAANWVLSGRSGTPFGSFPALGAIVAHECGGSATVPPYVAVPRNPAFTWEVGKSAYLGSRCEALPAGDPNQTLSEQLRESLHTSAERNAFAIDREPQSVRDRYGRTTPGQSMLLARRLVESGTRFVTVSYSGWDHHHALHARMRRMLPEFDRGLSALIEEMHERGTFEQTLLVVMSEFGRTPRFNSVGGRGHWSHASSLLFAGAGVRQGFVLGRTDRHGAFVTDRPVSPADVAHTILDTLGIDSRKEMRNAEGRPIAILDQGAKVQELFE